VTHHDLIGFVRWDGERYWGFIYYKPGDDLDYKTRIGFYEVYVDRIEAAQR
jgi:hypothetical protein